MLTIADGTWLVEVRDALAGKTTLVRVEFWFSGAQANGVPLIAPVILRDGQLQLALGGKLSRTE